MSNINFDVSGTIRSLEELHKQLEGIDYDEYTLLEKEQIWSVISCCRNIVDDYWLYHTEE